MNGCAIDTVHVCPAPVKLIDACLPLLNQIHVKKPRISYAVVAMGVSDGGAFESMHGGRFETLQDLWGKVPLPNVLDIMAKLLEHGEPRVRLTRSSLLRIVQSSPHREQLLINPHEWASAAVKIIRDKLAEQLVEGVKYIKVSDLPGAAELPDDDKWYSMQRIEDEDIIEVLTSKQFVPDENEDKTIYDRISCDSETEMKFAQALDKRSNVKLYVKLPTWFVVETPVGNYRPDWAIVCEGPEKDGKPVLYLVAETKSSLDPMNLRGREALKIRFAERHFGCKPKGVPGALEGIDYNAVTNAEHVPW